MTTWRFLHGRSSGASSSKRSVPPMSLSARARGGRRGPVDGPKPCSHMGTIASPGARSPRTNGTMGTWEPMRTRCPVLPPQTSAFARFLRCNRCIGADTPTPTTISSGPAHSHRLDSPLQLDYCNLPLGSHHRTPVRLVPLPTSEPGPRWG
jgi:hypothetical protein